MFKKIFIATFFLSIGLFSHADSSNVTPYGDYCRECTAYGSCKETLPPKKAMTAISSYYRDKGYTVGEVRHKGRFIEAEIYEGSRLVDKVIFDRKTGRIRSIL